MTSVPEEERPVDIFDDMDVLPDQTRDESDLGWGGPIEPDDDEARLRAERPPHW